MLTIAITAALLILAMGYTSFYQSTRVLDTSAENALVLKASADAGLQDAMFHQGLDEFGLDVTAAAQLGQGERRFLVDQLDGSPGPAKPRPNSSAGHTLIGNPDSFQSATGSFKFPRRLSEI